ncbi:MAG: flagellar basal body L-ring protein FlgH [Gammaproteobacteria bacterium]|nr:flagellar basal body L-ring protein FlgH [Gammaproteobacteria bacterium]
MRSLIIIFFIVMLSACASMDDLRNPEYAPTQPSQVDYQLKPNGTIYSPLTAQYLFEDIKARRVGDTITVVLEESTQASKSAKTSAKRANEVSIANPTILGHVPVHKGNPLFTTSLSQDSSFSGQGNSAQSNNLSGNVTVTVAEVLGNGNLLVKGEKLLTLNEGSEVVRVKGIVRPIDISPDNTILSTQIAAAEITYGGNGIVGNSNKPGPLTRFLNSSWWPL